LLVRLLLFPLVCQVLLILICSLRMIDGLQFSYLK